MTTRRAAVATRPADIRAGLVDEESAVTGLGSTGVVATAVGSIGSLRFGRCWASGVAATWDACFAALPTAWPLKVALCEV